jgi:DNA ligase-1
MRVIDIISELQKTSSTNKKVEIIKQNKDNVVFAEILKLAYDPHLNFYLRDVDVNVLGPGDINESWHVVKNLFDVLYCRMVTGNTARALAEEVMSKFDVDSQTIIKMIFDRDLRCNIGASLINKALGKNFIQEFKVQLANKYDSKKNYKVDFFFATPKLDGIRAFWTKNTPNVLWSRGGKEFVGLEHVLEDIKKIIDVDDTIEFLDGELFAEKTEFSDIQGTVVSNVNYTQEDKNRIKYNIFAVGGDKFNATEDMQLKLINLAENHRYPNLNYILAQKIQNDAQKIRDMAKMYVDDGYEGIMLRHPKTSYEFKRSDSLLKFKFFDEADLDVVGMVEGAGKYEGMLGALVCNGVIDGKYIETEVGTGFTDDQRNEFWLNKDTLVGRLAEIKFQEISSDSTGKFSLRFPVFLKFKLDR